MDFYSLGSVLYEGETLKTYEAWSERDQKDVVVKVYKRNDIRSAECLLKEAIRQAREKPQESVGLMDVVLSAVEKRGTGKALFVNYVLEKRARQIAKDLLERDDDRGQFEPGMTGYEKREKIYAQERKKVHLGYSARLGKDVIIKSETCFVVSDANTLLREAFMLAYVEHPYNCQLYDISISQKAGSRFKIHLIMEKFERDVTKDIDKRIKRGEGYSEAELLQFLKDVTRGFDYARNLVTAMQGIAHRDIKPQNIFITADGQYKVGDFGCAWKRASRTHTLSAAGTGGYMSPEMLRCMTEPDAFRVDSFLADIYSLGVTLLHMAAQRFPLMTESVLPEDIERSRDETLASIDYSHDLKQLIRDMMAVDHTLRIRLETVITRTEIMLARPAPVPGQAETTEAPRTTLEEAKHELTESPIKETAAKSPQPEAFKTAEKPLEEIEPTRQDDSQTEGPLFKVNLHGKIQIFDIVSKVWQAPLAPSQELPVDACYAFMNSTSVVLCGGIQYVAGAKHSDGNAVYQVECTPPRPTVTALPSFPHRRAQPGLYVYNGVMHAFGGEDHAGNCHEGSSG